MGFWDLCLARLPGTIVVFLFVLFFGWKLLPQRDLGQSDMLENGGMKGLKRSELPQWKQNLIYIIFIAVLLLLSFSRQLGINSMLITTVAGLLVILLGFLKEREAYSSVNWPLIFMMSFMLAISWAATA